MTPRFRPQLQSLEAREVPTVGVLYNGASLTLTGTPQATATEFLRVKNVGGHDYQVTDGTLNLGTYRVTTDINIKLTKFDNFIAVDVGGDTLGGNVLIDVGAGDTNPATLNRVFVASGVAGGKVAGDVNFRNGSGIESFNVSGVLQVGKDVRAIGPAVTSPALEDKLTIETGAVVHGDVRSDRITYTTISGTVDGNVIAYATGSPGGMGFTVDGTVHGYVSASGGAVPGYYSYAYINGRVDGDVLVNLTGGKAYSSVSGTVGGDWTVRHTGGGYVSLAVRGSGEVKKGVSVVTADDAATDQTTLSVEGVVRGDLRFKETGKAGAAVVGIDGYVAGNVAIDLGGPDIRYSSAYFGGAVGKSADVIGKGKVVSVLVEAFSGYDTYYGVPGLTTVTGDLNIKLGNGSNSLDLVQIFDDATRPIGGKLSYTGGSGSDVVNIAGQFGFTAKLDLGAGSDTVAFTPLATVGALDVDFGADTDTWTPPTLITFPVKLKNL